MPSITTASKQVTDFPFRYISPFKDDPVVPLYSSVPLFAPQAGCLPCAACGNYADRKKIIAQQANRFKDYIPNEIAGNNPKAGFN
jgi:hypothetical protein